jgi:biotin carboxyl carrier protein
MSTTLRSTRRSAALLLALAVALTACGQRLSESEIPGPAAAVGAEPSSVADRSEPLTAPDDEATQAPDEEPAETPAPEVEVEEPAPEEPPEHQEPVTPERHVGENAWTPFASVEGVVLHHPSARVERIGFHQANHDGARQLEPLEGAIAAMTLDSRGRTTGSRSAADVVVDPEVEIRAPVTGTVLRAGTYVLYCDYSDDFVVVEPDARPGWEVKVLHIDGVRVAEGDRVTAGETVIAPRPTPLPFESQVDEHTAEPSWPHVHLEVVDPSIPNESSGGGC